MSPETELHESAMRAGVYFSIACVLAMVLKKSVPHPIDWTLLADAAKIQFKGTVIADLPEEEQTKLLNEAIELINTFFRNS